MATYPVRLSVHDLPAHLPTLKAELLEGHTVELVSDGEVIGEVRARAHEKAPESYQEAEQRPPMPDFMARLQARWGDRVFEDSTQMIREDRDAGF